jgi:hypothetical protein
MITIKTTTDDFHDLWDIVNKTQGEYVYKLPRELVANLLLDHGTFSSENKYDIEIEDREIKSDQAHAEIEDETLFDERHAFQEEEREQEDISHD